MLSSVAVMVVKDQSNLSTIFYFEIKELLMAPYYPNVPMPFSTQYNYVN